MNNKLWEKWIVLKNILELEWQELLVKIMKFYKSIWLWRFYWYEFKIFEFVNNSTLVKQILEFFLYKDKDKIAWLKNIYLNYFKYIPTYLWNIYIDSLYIWKKNIAKSFFEFLFENNKYYNKTITIFSKINIKWYKKQIEEIKNAYLKYEKKKLKEIWYSEKDIKKLIIEYEEIIKKLFNDEFLLETNPNWIDRSSKFFLPFSMKWFIEFIASNFVPIWNYKSKWVFPIVEFFDYVNFWNLIYERWQNKVKKFILFNSKVFTPMFLYWIIQSKKLEQEYNILDIEWIIELANMNYI